MTESSFCPIILVPRGRAPFGQHQESRPLAKSNTGSPRFTDFPSLCACSESSLTNLIGSGLNLLCLLSHSKTECRWTRPEVAILGADQKERGLWGRECCPMKLVRLSMSVQAKSKEGRTPQSSEIFYLLSLKNSFGLKSVVEKIRFRCGFVHSRPQLFKGWITLSTG